MVKQETLIEFEHVRAGYKLIGDSWVLPIEPEVIIPPAESNSFYDIGDGSIDLFTINADPLEYRFGLTINSGEINIGIGSFQIDGHENFISSHYKYLDVKENTKLNINSNLTLTNAIMHMNGSLNINSLSSLILREESEFNTSNNSVLTLNSEGFIFVDENSQVNLYGTINVHITKIESILNQSNIYIDPTTKINLIGINSDGRSYSLQNFVDEINSSTVNVNTIKEKNFDGNQVRCKWTDGSPINDSHSISIYCESGRIILGDLKLSFLGLNENLEPSMKTLSDLIINENATLVVSEEFNGYHYYYPSLYIGRHLDNNKVPAKCIVNGKIELDGNNTNLNLDRNGSMIINGTVKLSNNSKLIISNTTNKVLTINGNLIIDSIDQLSIVTPNNITFGSKGKLIILNPSINKDQIILEIPNGIQESKLYELFRTRLNHIEFHITSNMGIKIDQYFENFPIEMKQWYGNYTLIDAIKNGLIVWEDNGFIELNNEVIKWATIGSNLYDLTKLFMCSGNSLKEEIQSIVDKFIESGSGNVRFKFVENELKREIILTVNIPDIKSVYYDNYHNDFVIQVSSSSYLFITNNLSALKKTQIVKQQKYIIPLLSEYNHFKL